MVAMRRARHSLCQAAGAAGTKNSHPHPPGSVEHIIVTQGKALVGLTEAPEELAEGDYICYPGDQAHIFKALEPDTQAILVAEQN